MMESIGKKIYYDKSTGSPILETEEQFGFVRETTVEEDFQTYVKLAERLPETVGVIQLEYKQFEQDFIESIGYRINPETRQIEFSYPDPNEPEAPPVFVKPLTEKIKEVENQANATSADLQEFMEHYFTNGGI